MKLLIECVVNILMEFLFGFRLMDLHARISTFSICLSSPSSSSSVFCVKISFRVQYTYCNTHTSMCVCVGMLSLSLNLQCAIIDIVGSVAALALFSTAAPTDLFRDSSNSFRLHLCLTFNQCCYWDGRQQMTAKCEEVVEIE